MHRQIISNDGGVGPLWSPDGKEVFVGASTAGNSWLCSLTGNQDVLKKGRPRFSRAHMSLIWGALWLPSLRYYSRLQVLRDAEKTSRT